MVRILLALINSHINKFNQPIELYNNYRKEKASNSDTLLLHIYIKTTDLIWWNMIDSQNMKGKRLDWFY